MPDCLSLSNRHVQNLKLYKLKSSKLFNSSIATVFNLTFVIHGDLRYKLFVSYCSISLVATLYLKLGNYSINYTKLFSH